MSDWTLDELMVAAIARELGSDDRCVNGAASFIPVAAIGAARLTHAPGLLHLGGAVGVDARWTEIGPSTVGTSMWTDATALLNHPDEFWPMMQAGRFNALFHRAAQIDARGNLNNSVIDRPGGGFVRLPGGAAMGDLGSLASKIILWTTTHNPRTLVERVDRIGCAGYLDGPDDRERLGLPGGPRVLVTDLAVLDFSPRKRLRIRSVHPGVDPDRVAAATGFELDPPDGEITETEPPDSDLLAAIRRVDPGELRKTEFRRGVPSHAREGGSDSECQR